MNFKILDTFVDCPAGVQKKTCAGNIDLPQNYKCTVVDFGDITEPRIELNITSCKPSEKFYIRMLRSFGEQNELPTLLMWYPKSTSKKGNFIPSNIFNFGPQI